VAKAAVEMMKRICQSYCFVVFVKKFYEKNVSFPEKTIGGEKLFESHPHVVEYEGVDVCLLLRDFRQGLAPAVAICFSVI